MFIPVFWLLFFPFATKYETTVLGNEKLMKLSPNDTGEHGVSNVVLPPGEWRMLIICVIYATTLAQSPARRLRYKTMSGRMDLI